MKYNDKWAISEFEPKTDVLWVQPGQDEEDESIKINAFVNGKWKAITDKSAQIVDNKEYKPTQFSGLGRMNLEKNIQAIESVEKNILTQDMFYKDAAGSRVPNTNTIFVIQYDYDLNGQTITIPEGCVLKFDGGSISNGLLNLNGCTLDGDVKITAEPAWNEQDETYEDYKPANKVLSVSWFGAKGDGITDDSFALRRAVKWLHKSGATLIFDICGTYLMGDGIVDDENDTGKTLHTGYSYDGTYIFQGTEFSNMSAANKKQYIEEHPNNIGREISLIFFKFNNLTIEGNNSTLLSNPNNGICRHNVLFIMCACRGCKVNNLTLDDNSFNRVSQDVKFILTDGAKYQSVFLPNDSYESSDSYYAVIHRDRGVYAGVNWGDLDYCASYGALKTAYISDVRDSRFFNFNSIHAVHSCADIKGTFQYRELQGLQFDSCLFEYALYHVITVSALIGAEFTNCTIQYGGLNEDLTDSEYAWNVCSTLDLESDFRRQDGQIEFLQFYNCKFGRSKSDKNQIILNIEAHDILFDRCVFNGVPLNSVPCVGGYNNEVAYCTFINCMPGFRQEGIYVHHNYIYYNDVRDDLYLFTQTKNYDVNRTFSFGFLFTFSVVLNSEYTFKSWADGDETSTRAFPIYTVPEYIILDSNDNEYTSENGKVVIGGVTVASLSKQQGVNTPIASAIPTRVEYNIFKFDYTTQLDNTKHVGLLKGADNLHFRNNTIINAHNSNVNTLSVVFFDNNKFIQEKEKYSWLLIPSFSNALFPCEEGSFSSNEGAYFRYVEKKYKEYFGLYSLKFYFIFTNTEMNLDELFSDYIEYIGEFEIHVKSGTAETIFKQVDNGSGGYAAFALIKESIKQNNDIKLYYKRERPLNGGCIVGGNRTAYVEILSPKNLLYTNAIINGNSPRTTTGYIEPVDMSSTIATYDNPNVGKYALGDKYLVAAKQLIHYNDVDKMFIAYDGASYDVSRSGTTRPSGDKIYVGFQFFDETLGYPIYAKAIAASSPYTVTWVDSTGETV